jgi:acetyl esterase/lipase
MSMGARKGNRGRGDLVERRYDFGPDPRQHIIFIYDNTPAALRRNAIFFVHGGAWSLGSPEGYRFIGRYLGGLGFPVIMAGYRLAPKVRFADQIEDIYASLQTGLQKLDEHGLGQKDLIVGGQSAGAQLAGLLVYDRQAQAVHHVDQNIFTGLALLSGPMDFTGWENRAIRNLFKDLVNEGEWEASNPIRHVRGDENIPVICFHGERDAVVPPRDSESFVGRINASSPGLAELVITPGAHHSDVMAMFNGPCAESRALNDWLDRVDKRCC